MAFSITSLPLRQTAREVAKLVTAEAVLQRAPFFIAAALGSYSWSFGWVLVLCQAFIYFILAPKRVLWNSLGAGSPTLGSDMHAKLDDSMENNEQVQDYPKCHHAFPLPDPFDLVNSPTDPLAQEQGVLKIESISASDLHARDWTTGASDPYCVMYLTDQTGTLVGAKFQTKTEKRTVSPTWEDFFSLPVHVEEGCSLMLEVFDYNAVSADEKLGFAQTPLANLFDAHHTSLVLEGYLVDGKPVKGSVHINTRYIRVGESDESEAGALLTKRKLHRPAALLACHGAPPAGANGQLVMMVRALALYVLVAATFCVCYFFGHVQWDMLILTPLIELTLFMEKNQASFEAMYLYNDPSSPSPAAAIPGATRGAAAQATSAAEAAAAARAAARAGKGKGRHKGGVTFNELRRISAEGLLKANAEWLTGALVLIWELWRPWLDALVAGLINGASPFIHADVCSFGGSPIVCTAVESRKRGDLSPLSYELDLNLEWASDLYMRICLDLSPLFSSSDTQTKTAGGPAKKGVKSGGIPLVTVSGLHLNLMVRASLKLTDVDGRDHALFPGLAKLALCLPERPELDLQLRLFGMVDILALPGLSMIKGLIVDFLCNMMGPQPDGSLKPYEIMDDSTEKAAIYNIEQSRRGVTQAGALWDARLTPAYKRESEALIEHVHVLVVRVLFATDMNTDAEHQCVIRYGVGADKETGNDVTEYVTSQPKGAERNVWQEEHSFVVRTNADILQLQLKDKSGKLVGRWGDTLGNLRDKLLDHAPIATPHYKICDLGQALGYSTGNVHLILRLLNPRPPPSPPRILRAEGKEAAVAGDGGAGAPGVTMEHDIVGLDAHEGRKVDIVGLDARDEREEMGVQGKEGEEGKDKDLVSLPDAPIREDWQQWEPIGLRWETCGFEKPVTGTEIENAELAAALAKQTWFSCDELEALKVAVKYAAQNKKYPPLLDYQSFIQVPNKGFFKPDAPRLDQMAQQWSASGLLHIQLIKCLNMPSDDSSGSGRNDAFCAISVGHARDVNGINVGAPPEADANNKISVVKSNALRPSWGALEGQFLFEIDSAKESGVRTTVFDKDSMSNPDFIGTCLQTLGSLRSNASGTRFRTRVQDIGLVPLLDQQMRGVQGPDTQSAATVHMVMEFTPSPMFAKAHVPRLLLRVLGAKGLPRMDSVMAGGAADPYCVVTLTSKDFVGTHAEPLSSIVNKRTSTQKNTREPTWPHAETFVFYPTLDHDETLAIQMYDENTYGEDEEIGNWSTRTTVLWDPKGNADGKAIWCPLFSDAGGKCGNVQIEVQFLGDWSIGNECPECHGSGCAFCAPCAKCGARRVGTHIVCHCV